MAESGVRLWKSDTRVHAVMPQRLSPEHGSLYFKSASCSGSLFLWFTGYLGRLICLKIFPYSVPEVWNPTGFTFGISISCSGYPREVPDHHWISSGVLQSLAGCRAWRSRAPGKCLEGCRVEKTSHEAHIKTSFESSYRGRVEINLTRNHEVARLIPGLAQWVKDPALPWFG